MDRLTTNGILAALTISIPLIAEVATTTPEQVPGTGFSVLLYEPFHFAYLCLVTICFIALNARICIRTGKGTVYGAALGIGITAIWFVAAFFAVGQLHISLGGKL